MALMNKRDALKYLASVTDKKMKDKIKDTLHKEYERQVRIYGKDNVPKVSDRYAVRAYYQAVIDEAFGESKISYYYKGKGMIRTSTLKKAIEKIGRTSYVKTEDERYIDAVLKGYEDMGMTKQQLREQLGVSKLRKDYFEYIKTDDDGNEVIGYEDKIIFIQFVRDEEGNTLDVVVKVAPRPYVGRRRYAI